VDNYNVNLSLYDKKLLIKLKIMILIYTLIVTSCFFTYEYPLIGTTGLNIEPIIIIAMWLHIYAYTVVTRKWNIINKNLLNILGIFALIGFIATLLNISSLNMEGFFLRIGYLMQYILYISLIFLIPFYVKSQKHIKNVMLLFFLSYVVVLILSAKMVLTGSLFQNVNPGDEVGYMGVRMSRLSFFSDYQSNAFGGFVVIGMLFCIYLLLQYKNRYIKLVMLPVLFLSFFELAFTFSREALLGLLVSLTVISLCLFKNKEGKKVFSITTIIGGNLIIFNHIFDFSAFYNRFLAYEHTFGYFSRDRLSYWINLLYELFDNPEKLFTGFGFYRTSADSAYVNIFYSLGIFGILIYFLFLYRLLYFIVRNINKHKSFHFSVIVLSMLTYFFVVDIFSDNFAVKKILVPLFMFIGLYFSLMKLEGVQDAQKNTSSLYGSLS